MSCQHCESDKTILSLQHELDQKNIQLERLEQDMHTLNQKYVAEIERVGNIQHEKDMVEHELEELSLKLFEEANAMVAVEKKARWQIENELRQTQEQLLAEQAQLRELRLRLTSDRPSDATSILDSSTTIIMKSRLKDQIDLDGLKRVSANHIMKYTRKEQLTQQRTISMPPTPSTSDHINAKNKRPSTIDGFQLESFREYTIASSQKLLTPKKLNQTTFMKHCLSEDIEPCLRFGPQSKLSIKKMIDFLSRQACFIEHIHTGLAPSSSVVQPSKPLWERFNANTPTKSIVVSNSCSACGRSADAVVLNYRFRLDETDNWLPIDQYCRDRLVAVCEFFVFIRNIQMNLYQDRSIEDLYTENIRLRLQMFYSRMGALPVVMDDLGLDHTNQAINTQPVVLEEEGDVAGETTDGLDDDLDLLPDDASSLHSITHPHTPEPYNSTSTPSTTMKA
ncbi:Guanine nucleotide exchange factor for Rab-3A [Choanephora cucurbitarum]|uniref:Guanine nucleotide exchange factor for Rab-3A n=1 Tax=Choanephora cucurbitarum TaxID=101091 RepID=A0A1C7NQW1_9FUNG|nr:Guanine nucleotide exchange factor for Rab-3A [Choanephora cucurbitarum]